MLAAIPYVVGYHPDDCVVVLAMRGKELLFSARDDFPDPDASWDSARHRGEGLVQIMRREGADAVMLVGFGAEDQVRPTVLAIRDVCEEAGLRVLELLRADGGRYWSYLCADPGCCPPEGSPYDLSTSAVAAEWTVAGRVALPDRDAYERQLDPVEGPGRVRMRQATVRAGDRLFELVTRPIDEQELDGEFLKAALEILHDAAAGPAAGRPLEDDEVAWLTVLLASEPVRAAAWSQIGLAPELADVLRTLWLDVMRRAEPDLRAAPAAMFGYAAWRCGDTHLARVAIERALELEPDLAQAHELRRALAAGRAPANLSDPVPRRPRRRPGGRPRRRSSPRRAGSQ